MKNKNAKKVVAVSMAALFGVSMLAGCGGSDSGSASSTDKKTAEATKTEDGKTVIRIVRPTQNCTVR